MFNGQFERVLKGAEFVSFYLFTKSLPHVLDKGTARYTGCKDATYVDKSFFEKKGDKVLSQKINIFGNVTIYTKKAIYNIIEKDGKEIFRVIRKKPRVTNNQIQVQNCDLGSLRKFYEHINTLARINAVAELELLDEDMHNGSNQELQVLANINLFLFPEKYGNDLGVISFMNDGTVCTCTGSDPDGFLHRLQQEESSLDWQTCCEAISEWVWGLYERRLKGPFTENVWAEDLCLKTG